MFYLSMKVCPQSFVGKSPLKCHSLFRSISSETKWWRERGKQEADNNVKISYYETNLETCKYLITTRKKKLLFKIIITIIELFQLVWIIHLNTPFYFFHLYMKIKIHSPNICNIFRKLSYKYVLFILFIVASIQKKCRQLFLLYKDDELLYTRILLTCLIYNYLLFTA